MITAPPFLHRTVSRPGACGRGFAHAPRLDRLHVLREHGRAVGRMEADRVQADEFVRGSRASRPPQDWPRSYDRYADRDDQPVTGSFEDALVTPFSFFRQR